MMTQMKKLLMEKKKSLLNIKKSLNNFFDIFIKYILLYICKYINYFDYRK